jgi:hypothetical protein
MNYTFYKINGWQNNFLINIFEDLKYIFELINHGKSFSGDCLF